MTHALSAACSKVLRTRVPRHHAWIFMAFCSRSGCFFFGGERGGKDKQRILREHSPPTSAPGQAKQGLLRSSGALGREPVDQIGVWSLRLSLNGPQIAPRGSGSWTVEWNILALAILAGLSGRSTPCVTFHLGLGLATYLGCVFLPLHPTQVAGEVAVFVCIHA